MKDATIYSIGHGSKEIEVFIKELKAFGIHFLLDIRSKPFSKWNPQFNQPILKSELENQGITYAYLGDSLGGLPNDPSCYDFNGKVVYERIKEKDFFKKGLERLITANDKKIPLAIMCSETNPKECHRSKLIGQELLKKDISLKHIISERYFKSQETVMEELTKGHGVIDLFGNGPDFTSRKSYM
ncbi:DUF488 family protein [Prolixibacter sp. NT017]|uniref:DUF488 domain-containing protein n=1 Tax=Prolixibacter sp. NT017 TaxID=2652390 RepID=UPI00127A72B0|nr:DUF488 domain-containing protein [Prolixibacter sp. NT017]GET25656.1 hypothetical protein NT017_19850 [Prolixibacter sp. NT017]